MSSSINTQLATLLSVLDNAVDAIISIDQSGEVLTYNAAAERMFQYSSEEVAALGLEVLMPESEQGRHEGYVDNYLRGGPRKMIGIGREVLCRRRDGSTFKADLSVSEAHVEGRRIFTAIMRDLSERDRLRSTLRSLDSDLKRSQQEHEIVLRFAPIGIVTMNARGCILTINRAVSRITGYQEQQLVGQLGQRFVHTDEQLEIATGFRELMRAGQSYSSSLHRLRSVTGDYLHVRTFNAAIRPSEDLEAMLICMFEDLSARHAQENELKTQRERLAHVAKLTQMGEMAAGLAHELNQPLSAISTYAGGGIRLLESDNFEASALADVLQKIGQQAQRAGSVIRKIRELTRRHETTRQFSSVETLVDELLTLIEIDVQHSGITLDVSQQANVDVLIDHVQIEQVILNFVRNAIDAVRGLPPERQTIRITTFVRDDNVVLEVADQGEGVPPSLRARVFDPYVSSKPQGMGMGLSISKSIIEAHDGRIGLISPDTGGAIFWFSLPITSPTPDEE